MVQVTGQGLEERLLGGFPDDLEHGGAVLVGQRQVTVLDGRQSPSVKAL